MSERCIKCGKPNGDHLVSCPVVANTPRVQARELEGHRYTGLLWIDESDGSTNFKFNANGGDFASGRKALQRFVAVIQKRLDDEEKCPSYEKGAGGGNQ
jgi:hypothetical protein